MQLEIKQVGPGDEALSGRIAEAVFDERIDPSRLAARPPYACGALVLQPGFGVVLGGEEAAHDDASGGTRLGTWT